MQLDINSFSGFAIALFAYTCHTNIFTVRLELRRPIVRRLNKIFFRAVTWELFIYTAVAIAGYLSLLD
jgi:amino acid permease